MEPGITGGEAKGILKESSQWVYPNLDPNKYELKSIIAACLAIGTRERFRAHVYSFGGTIFQQNIGGP